MSGVKGRSGRKKNPQNVLKYLNEEIDSNWYDLVLTLIDKAKNGDREALMYCFDRRLGKPKSSTELDITGGEHLGAGMMIEIFKVIAENRRKQIGEGDAIQIEGTSERSEQREDAET